MCLWFLQISQLCFKSEFKNVLRFYWYLTVFPLLIKHCTGDCFSGAVEGSRNEEVSFYKGSSQRSSNYFLCKVVNHVSVWAIPLSEGELQGQRRLQFSAKKWDSFLECLKSATITQDASTRCIWEEHVWEHKRAKRSSRFNWKRTENGRVQCCEVDERTKGK